MSTNTNEEQLTFGGIVVSDENIKAVEEPSIAPVESQTVQTPVEPQVMQQVPIQPTKPAPLGMKKPKKVGWIITLVFLVLSLIGVGVGVGLMVNGIGSLAKSMDSETVKKNEKPIENLGNGELIVSSLEKGKTYLIVSSIESGPKISGVRVDGVSVSEGNIFENVNQKNDNLNVYSFTATDKTALLTLKGISGDTVGNIYVVDGEEYFSNAMLIGIGVIILVVAGFIAFINLILFIIFLTIFLTRNSKYKKSLS